MIRLFVSDIDGCLAQPYTPYDLGALQTLAAHVAQGGALDADGPERGPAFTVCSGRPYGYVEAMTQVLGIRVPALFESGGGCFDPATTETRWHPHFTDAVAEQIKEARRWLKAEALPGTALKLDHEKRTQAGVVGPDEAAVERIVAEARAFVERALPGLRVFHTSVSIDIVAPNITKREGLAWLGEMTGCALDEMAYIGDTNGDLGALEAVGYAFAPAGAEAAVRAAADVVTGDCAEGTVEAYRWCLRHNEATFHDARANGASSDGSPSGVARADDARVPSRPRKHVPH